jgi:hypothetical protein
VFTRAKALDHWVSKKEELYAVCIISPSTYELIADSIPDWQGIADAGDATKTETNRPAGDQAERPA